mgnify:CR=1 FL=1
MKTEGNVEHTSNGDMHDVVVQADVVEGLKQLSDNSVRLFVLDPPYWKVVNEGWDFQWRVIEDYRKWCKTWFDEISRVATMNASLYVFGYVRNLVHLYQDICNLGFDFRQSITIDKGMKSIGGRKTSTYQMFPTTTETVWFFRKDTKPFIKGFLKDRQMELGFSAKEINEKLGAKSNGGGVWSLYTGDNILAQVPTMEMWERLQRVLEFEYPYDQIASVFNIEMGLTDVWSDIDFYDRKRIHPTQKPVELISRIIKASSNSGDLVCDPFFGSGSTGVACQELGRRFFGIEIDQHFVEQARKRLAGEETVSYAEYKKTLKKRDKEESQGQEEKEDHAQTVSEVRDLFGKPHLNEYGGT